VYCCAKGVDQQVGPTGHYLTQEHTRQHFREAWSPGLLDRHDHKTWQGLGGSTLGGRAAARVDQILREHQPEPLRAEVRAALRRIVARRVGGADIRSGSPARTAT
jgi:trimethylamine--corrinoid protein Co-methyltransferase